MRAASLVGWKLDRYDHIAVPGTDLEIPLNTLTPAALKMEFQTARHKRAVEQHAHAWSVAKPRAHDDMVFRQCVLLPWTTFFIDFSTALSLRGPNQSQPEPWLMQGVGLHMLLWAGYGRNSFG